MVSRLLEPFKILMNASMCCDGVQVDCNATVEGYCLVPAGKRFVMERFIREKIW